jgi:hypothetical protein
MSKWQKLCLLSAGLLMLIVFVGLPLSKAWALELSYPKIPGTEVIPNEKTSLAQYLGYIYYFIVDLLGIVAFIVLVVGGVQYLTSAGSVTKAKAARERLVGGAAGLFIILGAFVTLRTINPQLVNIDLSEPRPLHGICLYMNRETEEEIMHCFQENTPKVQPENFHPTELEFMGPQEELRSVFLFPKENYKVEEGSFINVPNPYLFRPGEDEGKWIAEINLASLGSIYFEDQGFGLYLFPHPGGQYTEETFKNYPKNMPRLVKGHESDLENFNDRTKSLMMRYSWNNWSRQAYLDWEVPGGFNPMLVFTDFFDNSDYNFSYYPADDESFDVEIDADYFTEHPFIPDNAWGAVVHARTKGEGNCGIIFPRIEPIELDVATASLTSPFDIVFPTLEDIDKHPEEWEKQIRSIHLFNQPFEVGEGSVTFYESTNMEGDFKTLTAEEIGHGWLNEETTEENFVSSVHSFKIEGSFVVILTDVVSFGNRCQFFENSQSDLPTEYVLGALVPFSSPVIRSVAIFPVVTAENI